MYESVLNIPINVNVMCEDVLTTYINVIWTAVELKVAYVVVCSIAHGVVVMCNSPELYIINILEMCLQFHYSFT